MARILAGIIIVSITTGIVYFGSPLLFLFFAATVLLVAVYEYFKMIDRVGVNGFPILGMVLSLLLLLIYYFYIDLIIGWGLIASLTLFGSWFLKEDNVKVAIDQISHSLFGILYVAGLGGYCLLIRKFENGGTLILFLFLIVWLGDISAYYWGKNFGKKPLSLLVSPNKTIEGSIAGLIGSILAGVIAGTSFLDYLTIGHCLLVALLCGIIGQFGDLAESLLKRYVGVKDSSNIIPGHGGFLDRIDSLLFAGPVFYFYFKLVI